MKKTIGRSDRADFPELDLKGIKVKIDTGAYSSSIYATAIHERMYRGKKHLYFKSLAVEHPKYHGKTHRFEHYTKKKVKSSNGNPELRYFIETQISLFGIAYDIIVSLTDRRSMRFPVLIGRQLIRSRFTVDVNKTNLSHKYLRTQTKKKASNS